MLPKKAIDEYKEIYKKEFGKEINDKEATEQALQADNNNESDIQANS